MKKNALLSQGTGYLQNFTADNIEVGKFKTNDLISEESYVSLKAYTCFMNSFEFIHCFLPKQSKRSLSFTCNSLFKHNNTEMIIHSQLAKIRPSSLQNLENAGLLGQSCMFFILLGFDDNNVLLKYFYIFIFCSVELKQTRSYKGKISQAMERAQAQGNHTKFCLTD